MSYIVYEDQVETKELPGRSLKWFFTPEMNKAVGFTFNVVNIKPGNTVKPAHSHQKNEELIYIVSGSGKVYIDGEVYKVETGAAILFSPGSIHMLRNSGDIDMKVACFFTPPATLSRDYTFHEEVEFPE